MVSFFKKQTQNPKPILSNRSYWYNPITHFYEFHNGTPLQYSCLENTMDE